MTSRPRVPHPAVRPALARFAVTTAIATLVGLVPALVVGVAAGWHARLTAQWPSASGLTDGELADAALLRAFGVALGLVVALVTVVVAARVDRAAVRAPRTSAVGAVLSAAGLLATLVLATVGSGSAVVVGGVTVLVSGCAVALVAVAATEGDPDRGAGARAASDHVVTGR